MICDASLVCNVFATHRVTFDATATGPTIAVLLKQNRQMHIEKYAKAPRYKTPNFRQKHMTAASVDAEGRVALFGKEVNGIVVEDRFHFFEEALDAADWERARAFYGLPKRKRHSLRSHGVRRGEGWQVGITPKRSIHVIQDERGKEAGEASYRIPRFTKRETEEMLAASTASNFDLPAEEPPF